MHLSCAVGLVCGAWGIVGANSSHGVRRTNADKRAAVLLLLNDVEWAAWSDNEIAKRVGVSQPFVGELRPKEPTYNGYKSTERRGADGRIINTAAIGHACEGLRSYYRAW